MTLHSQILAEFDEAYENDAFVSRKMLDGVEIYQNLNIELLRSFFQAAINRTLDAALKSMPKKKPEERWSDGSLTGGWDNGFNAALTETRQRIKALKE